MKSLAAFFISLQVILVLATSGCGTIKDMYATKENKEQVPTQIANQTCWVVYEVWINKNKSGVPLTGQPGRAEHDRIILSPLYHCQDSLGAQNDSTINKWIRKLLEDDDIYYLAIRKVDDNLTYDQAFEVYERHYKQTQDINSTEGIEAGVIMENPLEIYRNGERKYDFPIPYFGILPQSRRGLEISQGVARLK